jgi:hypothetical protein
MPLPTADDLAFLRAEANSHGQTAATIHDKTETNTALGPTVAYSDPGTAVLGMRYSIQKTQNTYTGAVLLTTEEHFTCPHNTGVTPDQVLKIGDDYYEIIDVSTVDDNLLILKDLKLKRIKV